MIVLVMTQYELYHNKVVKYFIQLYRTGMTVYFSNSFKIFEILMYNYYYNYLIAIHIIKIYVNYLTRNIIIIISKTVYS